MASLGMWPSTIRVRTCRLVMVTNQIISGAGSEQVIDRLNDHWRMELTLPSRQFATAAEFDAFVNEFRGQVNWIKAYHFGRPKPLGTLDGVPAPVLQATATKGASEIRIATAAGRTLERGDLFGASGLLFMAAAKSTAGAGGTMIVPITNRVRFEVPAGTAVEWDRPTANFRCISHSGVNYVPGFTEEVTMTLREKIG